MDVKNATDFRGDIRLLRCFEHLSQSVATGFLVVKRADEFLQ
jgi:hypothetical protein